MSNMLGLRQINQTVHSMYKKRTFVVCKIFYKREKIKLSTLI